MKNFTIFITLLVLPIILMAQELEFDSKFVKVGYFSNQDLVIDDNSYLVHWGDVDYSFSDNPEILAKTMMANGEGNRILGALFQKDSKGLHADKVYAMALTNTTVYEEELAAKDASAESTDVLKSKIAKQLLKNIYIIILDKEITPNVWATKYSSKTKTRVLWEVFHVDITEQTIEQAYNNWNKPELFNQIRVPISYVAQGKSKPDRLFLDISKQVPNFAPRAAITETHPIKVNVNESQGVRKMDMFNIYEFVESENGDITTEKIGESRAVVVDEKNTTLYPISGAYPSVKKGEIAVLSSRPRSAFSLITLGSFGEDWRYGARLEYSYLMNINKHGIASYLIGSIEYNTYAKEPDYLWHIGDDFFRPKLSNFAFYGGYSIGFNFWRKFEVAPYAMLGIICHTFSNYDVKIVNSNGEVGGVNELQPNLSFGGCAGAKLNINICYPLQFTLGVEYNFSSHSEEELYMRQHTVDRVNVLAGFRYNF